MVFAYVLELVERGAFHVMVEFQIHLRDRERAEGGKEGGRVVGVGGAGRGGGGGRERERERSFIDNQQVTESREAQRPVG